MEPPNDAPQNRKSKTHTLSTTAMFAVSSPIYSGPPPLLDLTGRKLEDGGCESAQHERWEARFSGIMGIGPTKDLGTRTLSEATSITQTTIDMTGPTYALPAKQSSIVVIGKPTADRVCIPQSRHYIYTRFDIAILEDLKIAKHGPRAGGQVIAAQFGGSVRFPSGHLGTFLLEDRGFIEAGKRYVLFMWRPIRSDDTYVISQAYLIQDGLVFPVSATASDVSQYVKMPLNDFEAKVKSVVAKNIDSY